MDIRGEDGQTLKDKFAQGPRTYMGISSAGFPNLFTINAASVGNFVRAAEPLVEWVAEAIRYLRENEFTRISATPEAEDEWVQHVAEGGAKILRTQANSWFRWGETYPVKHGSCSPVRTPPPSCGPSVRR